MLLLYACFSLPCPMLCRHWVKSSIDPKSPITPELHAQESRSVGRTRGFWREASSWWGFPVGASGESACQCRRRGFDPWVGKSPRVGSGNPLQYSCMENSMDRGAWWAYSLWGHKELDMAEWLSICTHKYTFLSTYVPACISTLQNSNKFCFEKTQRWGRQVFLWRQRSEMDCLQQEEGLKLWKIR